MLGGQVDAVTADNTILAGFAAQPQNEGRLKVVGTFVSNEVYGTPGTPGGVRGI